AWLLLDHLGSGEMNDRIDALEVDASHVVPLLSGHFLYGQIFRVPSGGIGDENVQAAEPRDGMFDKLLVLGVLTHSGLESFHASAVLGGFLLDLQRGVLGFDVVENYVGASLCKEFDGRRADSTRTAGDECRLACERNHQAPKKSIVDR